jgi:pimeloyl-ACP methyl ester carboxylesterase
MHGWGGRPAQWASTARHLAGRGYRVLIPELPGHAGGRRTDIVEAADVVRRLLDEVGEPELVLTHSFAALVARLAFAAEAPDRVVMVAPALDVEDALIVFSERLRLMSWTRRGLRRRLQRWDTALWPTLASLHPDQLPGARVLVIHDPDDNETPFARSAELAAIRPATSIVALPGAGHSRILSSGEAMRSMTDFVLEGSEVGHDAA